ncbi:hypothetical protein [Nocardia salmonicida]|uniref:hypothetical protein n=1 Tax=Nocardia salmonicida TaxID=53431 RepID=UPI00364400CB
MSITPRTMVLIYATPDQLADWCSAAQLDKLGEGDDVRYLREASGRVRKATQCDLYDVTPAGAPSDPDQMAAFTAATCVQVREWIAAEINPLAGASGLKGPVASVSTNGSSVAYANVEQAAARAASLTDLVDSAREILRAAGLASSMVARR